MTPAFDIHRAMELLLARAPSWRVPVVDLIAAQGRDPFKVLVATILSARTRDATTAAACGRLFARAADPAALAALSEEEIRRLIHPVGFSPTKAKHLRLLPEALAPWGGKVPDSLEELLTLPGVGRKTANLVLAVAFGIPALCVDTHVHRISNIWGYVNTKTPLATEMALRKKLPKKYWLVFNSTLVAFGQHSCLPLGPRCATCVLDGMCPKIGIKGVVRRPRAARTVSG